MIATMHAITICFTLYLKTFGAWKVKRETEWQDRTKHGTCLLGDDFQIVSRTYRFSMWVGVHRFEARTRMDNYPTKWPTTIYIITTGSCQLPTGCQVWGGRACLKSEVDQLSTIHSMFVLLRSASFLPFLDGHAPLDVLYVLIFDVCLPHSWSAFFLYTVVVVYRSLPGTDAITDNFPSESTQSLTVWKSLGSIPFRGRSVRSIHPYNPNHSHATVLCYSLQSTLYHTLQHTPLFVDPWSLIFIQHAS